MENASKALLIAGAILLVIAIIAIGMAIFGQAQNVINDTATQMDGLTVSAHNNQFEGYLNKDIKGTQVREAIIKAASYNTKITDGNFAVSIVLANGTGATGPAGVVLGTSTGAGYSNYVSGLLSAGTTLLSQIQPQSTYVGAVSNIASNGLYKVITFTKKA